jgi:hypothetical protein
MQRRKGSKDRELESKLMVSTGQFLLGEKRSASIHCRTELLITQEGTHV